MTPFTSEPSDKLEIKVKANIVIAKYSSGPNSSATLARGGERSINAIMLTRPPVNDAIIDIPSALPACPFCAIGYPSNVVEILDGVPGRFNRIAGIIPPETPPIYRPMSNAIPLLASIPNVIGKQIATAIVAVRQGIELK